MGLQYLHWYDTIWENPRAKPLGFGIDPSKQCHTNVDEHIITETVK